MKLNKETIEVYVILDANLCPSLSTTALDSLIIGSLKFIDYFMDEGLLDERYKYLDNLNL